MKNPQTLCLLTQKFPFESGEEFLVPELKRLANEFEQIILIPTSVRDYSFQRKVPENVLIQPIRNPETPFQVASALVQNFPQFLTLLKGQISWDGLNFYQLKYWVYHIPFALKIRNELEKLLNQEENPLFYSYWVDTNAFAISLLKRKYPNVKFVVRTHGGDLYNERSPSGRIAFRNTIYQETTAIWPISSHGMNYILDNFSEHKEKVKLSRLGVEDFGMGPISPSEGRYHIVTCSSLIPLKRVELIAQVLFNSVLPIRWTHFGGGNKEFDRIIGKLGERPQNLEISFKGKVSNEALMHFYSTQFVDSLVNLSESEGIPVSMMEAISFGIPVFANRVGGIGELVVDSTGCLVEEGQNVDDLVRQFEDWIKSGKSRDPEFRKGVRRFWELNFRAETNLSGFMQRITAAPEEALS
ncbi:glycosyltransferase [Algoriphagus sp. oki45]|uniref:glycosyltransferase n=1 Tax=Algoriphagus sp. oki45 TaxID=3067294 RepID=UPI0030C74D58